MKILIIGAKGFIGWHAYQFFSKTHEVWGADISPADEPGFFLLNTPGTDFTSIFKTTQFDICINTSGNGSVPVSFNDPLLDFELNVTNTIKILDAIRLHYPTCRYINFSSAAVYGNPESLPVTEQMSPKPLSPYGWHKLYSEQICREYFVLYNIKTISLRVFSVYGENLRKQLFWDIFQKTIRSKDIELFGTGQETRDFIYIRDLVQAINCIIEKAPFNGEVINVSSGIETTIKQAAKIFCASVDDGINITFNKKTKPGDPLNWKADISILSSLGFKNTTSIETGLNRTGKWLKENI
jgi:UDP-glucose 4-epimerase